mmetsp:Transcript_54055/g.124444  ORF Transcript_54055/g.124444 Transcript_54055/m.124444 type:complete len:209 (+) Transcript_54055:421-1047(+)
MPRSASTTCSSRPITLGASPRTHTTSRDREGEMSHRLRTGYYGRTRRPTSQRSSLRELRPSCALETSTAGMRSTRRTFPPSTKWKASNSSTRRRSAERWTGRSGSRQRGASSSPPTSRRRLRDCAITSLARWRSGGSTSTSPSPSPPLSSRSSTTAIGWRSSAAASSTRACSTSAASQSGTVGHLGWDLSALPWCFSPSRCAACGGCL